MLSKYVDVKWTPYYKNKYEKSGYTFTKMGDLFNIKVEHLSKGSEYLVSVKCDYCNKEYQIPYERHIKQTTNGVVHKDCCNNCKPQKQRESNMIVYGVDHTSKLIDVKNKLAKRLDFEVVIGLFREKGFILLSKEKEYRNIQMHLKCICLKHINEGIQLISYAKLYQGGLCKYCYKESRTGENSPVWRGGNSDLKNYLRGYISDWKKESIKASDYKCILTNENNNDLEIHHLYSFSKMVDDFLKVNNYPVYRNIGDYKPELLSKITNEFVIIHNNLQLGVAIKKGLHKLFHKEFGQIDNTPEQFEEFKEKFRSGNYCHLLNKEGVF